MNVTVLGAGSWGLTIGCLLEEKGHQITFWSHSKEEVELLKSSGVYESKLPGVLLPKSFRYTTDANEALSLTDLIIVAVPSAFVRNVAKALAKVPVKAGVPVVSLTKGISLDTLQRMSEVLIEEWSWLDENHMVVVSGPSHAEEVAQKISTAVVAACADLTTATYVQEVFSNDYFRVYTSDDVIGVELCGSLKNVIAIATGVLDGLGLGDNTKGALITRGLVEMARLGEKMGANVQTFSGLAGMGDLITTCMSQHSRNRFVGDKIGQGLKLDDILASMTMVAEGVYTARSAMGLCKKFEVDMPISKAVYGALFENLDAAEAIRHLMNRSLKQEGIN